MANLPTPSVLTNEAPDFTMKRKLGRTVCAGLVAQDLASIAVWSAQRNAEIPMTNQFHLRFDSQSGSHVRATLFANGANCGQLCLRYGEWQILSATLLLGATRTNGHVVIEIDNMPQGTDQSKDS